MYDPSASIKKQLKMDKIIKKQIIVAQTGTIFLPAAFFYIKMYKIVTLSSMNLLKRNFLSLI